jgi:DEP domain-containing protein 5
MSRDRGSSVDTVKAAINGGEVGHGSASSKVVTLWVHDDAFSKEDVLINPDIFDGLELGSESLVEIASLRSSSEVRDFQAVEDEAGDRLEEEDARDLGRRTSRDSQQLFDSDTRTKCLLSIRPLPEEIRTKHPSLQISITSTIASAFGFRNRAQIIATVVSKGNHTASHVEIGFRDVYLARSDMWKLVESELAGKTVFSGQRILFLGTVKAFIKNIHVRGRRVNTAYFAATTVPVFRSEAARYVLFIQMSREMWDFDSEGNGEILFSRVINGFLPDLFRRWSSLDVRHLVTIVMFARLEYGEHDFVTPGDPETALQSANHGSIVPVSHEDFYRVVVTDMASAKWMTILDELKKDFRVFLRDVSLEHQLKTLNSQKDTPDQPAESQVKIRGRLSTAMKGNILEAINIGSTQLANDYIDRDLIRTGISMVVVTAGSGVFDVNRDLLNLTSENLTNNGIGIDVVCLSRMPLHSAPLFRYPVVKDKHGNTSAHLSSNSNSAAKHPPQTGNIALGGGHHSSFPSSVVSSMSPGISRVSSSVFTQDYMKWHYGIPHWIDLSYWTAAYGSAASKLDSGLLDHESGVFRRKHAKRFVPRVRMYEPQMMGIMELGLANISIPYIRNTSSRTRRMRDTLLGRRYYIPVEPSQSPKSSQLQTAGGLLTAHAKQQGDMIRRMDEYDANVFSHVRMAKSQDRSKVYTNSTAPPSPVTKRPIRLPKVDIEKSKDSERLEGDADGGIKAQKTNKGLLSLLGPVQKSGTPRISRSISYALRGLGAAPRATASTEINVENIQAQRLLTVRSDADPSTAGAAGSIISSRTVRDSDTRSSEDTDSLTQPDDVSAQSRDSPSMPISIDATRTKSLRKARRGSQGSKELHQRKKDSSADAIETLNLSSELELTSQELSIGASHGSDNDTSDDTDDGFNPGSITQDTIPFIRNVNASNPVKYDPNVATWFGRWQHLYPRKPKAATVKWRSLCTPASVPLTTEDFPGLENLKTGFNSSTYLISQKADNELREIPRTRKNLFSDMLALRLAHGYQWVTHSDNRGLHPVTSHDSASLLPHERLRQSDGRIYMTMGSTLQSLSHEGDDSVRVTIYRRNTNQDGVEIGKNIEYRPNIRTILSPDYKAKKLVLTGFSEEYPWELADSYMADPKKILDNAVEKLRFWRARFVLLPVDPPATAWRLAQSTSENEEEIHLLGIRALTQMWQRQRYIPAQEKTFKPPTFRNKNLNPLSIIFETLNPSEIVNTELEKLLSAEDAGDLQPTQLLPDSELFERETSTLIGLAQAMQGEKGIEIKNRRWHLRLHYNCFQGEDFTNWLLRTFKEGEFHDRDDCVEFGVSLTFYFSYMSVEFSSLLAQKLTDTS